MARVIALIHGINVGSTRKLPMADLRAACADAGLGPVATYIQSGNLVLEHHDPLAAERALEAVIAARFKLDCRSSRGPRRRGRIVYAFPFRTLLKRRRAACTSWSVSAPPVDAVDALAGRARDGERIARWGNEIAIHFTNGAGARRLSPVLIDRLVGGPATARNWNTVLKLREMAMAPKRRACQADLMSDRPLSVSASAALNGPRWVSWIANPLGGRLS